MILTGSALRAAGVPEPWTFGWASSVRFGEVDMLGHANNVAYFAWFEEARARYFVHRGVTRYGPDDPRLVVPRTEADFRVELRLHEDYVIAVRTGRIGRTSATQHYGVFTAGSGGEPRATGSAVSVWVRDGRPVEIPRAAREAMTDPAPSETPRF